MSNLEGYIENGLLLFQKVFMYSESRVTFSCEYGDILQMELPLISPVLINITSTNSSRMSGIQFVNRDFSLYTIYHSTSVIIITNSSQSTL